MKKFRPIVILIFVSTIFICCEETTSPAIEHAEVFQVHLQGGFEQTHVQLELDEFRVFNDTITTGSILSVAAIVRLDVFQGNHKLRVIINYSIDEEKTFFVGDSLYVAVSYDSYKKDISFREQTKPFLYR